jgi:trans-2,3-dihydro-3-hydroxyanthranilate isomerase
MKRPYVTLNVFTEQKFAGNPLAVVFEADGLSDAAMQTIAREFNLSETVFVQRPADPARRADLRIFTPARELPFAGHPTVGAAVAIALRDGAKGNSDFVLGEKVGPVPCRVSIASHELGRAQFDLPRLPERAGDAPALAIMAAALRVPESAIGFGAHQAALYSAGNPFTMIPIKTRAHVDAAVLDRDAFAKMEQGDAKNAFFYCAEPNEAGHHFYARMFAPSLGVGEDPATGSAVAAFAGAIMDFEKPSDGIHHFGVEQGYRMGRPSQIALTLHVAGGRLTKASIGGGAIVVMEGALDA